jgi:hypothetical protein
VIEALLHSKVSWVGREYGEWASFSFNTNSSRSNCLVFQKKKKEQGMLNVTHTCCVGSGWVICLGVDD